MQFQPIIASVLLSFINICSTSAQRQIRRANPEKCATMCKVFIGNRRYSQVTPTAPYAANDMLRSRCKPVAHLHGRCPEHGILRVCTYIYLMSMSNSLHLSASSFALGEPPQFISRFPPSLLLSHRDASPRFMPSGLSFNCSA